MPRSMPRTRREGNESCGRASTHPLTLLPCLARSEMYSKCEFSPGRRSMKLDAALPSHSEQHAHAHAHPCSPRLWKAPPLVQSIIIRNASLLTLADGASFAPRATNPKPWALNPPLAVGFRHLRGVRCRVARDGAVRGLDIPRLKGVLP
jgi:hypothetical protein